MKNIPDLTPNQITLLTKHQIFEICHHAASLAVIEVREYQKAFDELPNEISVAKASAFLGKAPSTINKWKGSKLRFKIRGGRKRDYFLKREFIEDCQKHNLV